LLHSQPTKGANVITIILAVTFLAAVGLLYVLGQAIRVARSIAQPGNLTNIQGENA
jgi:hypothetical protein